MRNGASVAKLRTSVAYVRRVCKTAAALFFISGTPLVTGRTSGAAYVTVNDLIADIDEGTLETVNAMVTLIAEEAFCRRVFREPVFTHFL